MKDKKLDYAISDCIYTNKRILPLIILFELAMILVQRLNLSAEYTSGENAFYYLSAYSTLLLASIVALALVHILDKRQERSGIVAVTCIYCGILLGCALFMTYLDARQGVESVLIYAAMVALVPILGMFDNLGMILLELLGDGIMLWIGRSYYRSFGAFFVNFFVLCIITLSIGLSYRKIRMNSYENRIKLEEMVEQRKMDAHTDELTGLRNRRAYHEALEELEQFGKLDLSLWIFDINGLKEVNDSLGHSAGDRLIKAAAKCIAEGFGGKNAIYRIGGDEFAVIDLANASPVEVQGKIERACSSEEWKSIGEVSLSMGCAISSEKEGMNLSDLEKLADLRMYESKSIYYKTSGKERRNKWTFLSD